MRSFIICILLAFSIERIAACPFCNEKIVERQIVFHEHELLVLHDRAPLSKGHLLIVPKRHVANAHELSPQEWKEFASILPRILNIYREAFYTDQYLLLEKNGPYAGQTVKHVHFHVIPIPSYKCADNVKHALFSKIFDTEPAKLSDEELQQEVNTIRSYLD